MAFARILPDMGSWAIFCARRLLINNKKSQIFLYSGIDDKLFCATMRNWPYKQASSYHYRWRLGCLYFWLIFERRFCSLAS